MKRLFTLLILACLTCSLVFSQQKLEKISMRDTLDNQFDFSNFLINANGFIPLPQLITEPALGGIGLALAPVFIQPNKYPNPQGYTQPNITAVAGMYTANKSWFVGGFRSGAITKHQMKYRVFAGYGSINLDLYRELPIVGESQFPFNFKTGLVSGTLLKEIQKSNVFVGVQYTLLDTEVSPEFLMTGDELPNFIQEKSLNTLQSLPGVLVEIDKRDNIFTPNSGAFFHADFKVSADWTGSDFTYQTLRIFLFKYFQFKENWVGGFRLETQQQFGNAPFFLEPGLNMRGVPLGRYQGTATYLLETEQRLDLSLRWSVLGFVGAAKAIPEDKTFGNADWVNNYGVGFRYLAARLFKLRMGVDLAWSQESFGYYIVFGSAWR
ncbi:BamA/TamA family outer membrane protein [Algoriphagus confluentis]|uniref:BamA/TamA family outer membrane protein n=2 Tax=Algoriphagus confluentis TaxID=1697556 RepID=A0ABQ6PNC6_9BACT|nr:BamA/TamA family outer membrane protein [Algoriphagus confluentis]